MRRFFRAVAALFLLACLSSIGYAHSALAESGEAAATNIYQEPFTVDYYLSGGTMVCYEYLHVGDWDITDAVLTLSYESSPLLQQQSATLFVYVNGASVYQEALSQGQRGRVSLDIPLPTNEIQLQNTNEVLIAIMLNDLPCGETVGDSIWLNIYKESEIILHYAPRTDAQSIGQFMNRFMDINSLKGQESTIYVNTQATTDELTTAMNGLMGTASGSLRYADQIGFARAGSVDAFLQSDYPIYITTADSMLPGVASLLSSGEQAMMAEGGVMALLMYQEKPLLLIAASDSTMLEQASAMLCNPGYMRTLDTTELAIQDADGYTLKMAEQDLHTRLLSQVDTSIPGAGRSEMSVAIAFPVDQVLMPASEIRLRFAYSPTLDFSRSLVTAYINGIPVGSKKLSADLAEDDLFAVSVPEDLELSGSFTITLAFDLITQENPCTLPEDSQPWVLVKDTSIMALASNDDTRFRFQHYPASFFRNGTPNSVVLLLPQQPNEADDEAARLVMVGLGNSLKDNTGSLSVRLGRDWGDLTSANIIAIGSAARNAILMENLEVYPFAFSTDAKEMLSNGQILVDPEYGQTVGVAQMINSPYSQWLRCLMVVTGATDEGMLHAAQSLRSANALQGIQGDVLLASASDTRGFLFGANPNEQEPPVQRTEEAPFVEDTTPLAITATLLLAGLAGLFHFLRYRKEEDS